ncbi:MAG: RNA-binding protein [Myxococcales bacterium]|nr:RNA-binding protein [Myxococcales bacterium]MCB9567464.1 RNA-binding protein [Myxococcales bacterium]MCB9700663.1 RNA-binding protein [Myxococcales bacterium]
MAKKINIGGLSVTTTETSLNNAFSPYGTIISLTLTPDPTGGPGEGDIEYNTSAEGDAAEAAMNGATLDGSVITVRGIT